MNTKDELQLFRHEINTGLSLPKKELYSKYFYDEIGSDLFNQITRHPDYYLTNCEIEILQKNKNAIASQFIKIPFNLIELGPGEGLKSKILIQAFLDKHLQFTYLPIDISPSYLKQISHDFQKCFANLAIKPLQGDYFHKIQWLNEHSDKCNLVLFLGSSIGNFPPAMANEFLSRLKSVLKKGDYLLIGFDLVKSENTMLSAYADSDGITRAFNLNLLHRINHELGGAFDITTFGHSAFFNQQNNAMESFLTSKIEQDVPIESLSKTFHFYEHEAIHMEYSYKYTSEMIHQYAAQNGFSVIADLTDEKNYFIDSLWQA